MSDKAADTVVKAEDEVTKESDEVTAEAEPAADDEVGQNIAKRKERRGNRKPGDIGPFGRAGVALLVLAVLFGLSFTGLFTVKKVDVRGNSYFSDEEIAGMAHADIGMNLWHGTSKREMKEYLEASPYIEKVSITRFIPGTIRIKVSEREQLGAVVFDDEYLVIDRDGLLLRRTDTEPKITIIKGLKVNKIEPEEKLGISDERMFDNTLELINAMKRGGLYFTEIEMSELYIRAHIYDSLVLVGTADSIIEAIDKTRLQQILDDLFRRGIKRGTIKLSDDGYASYSPKV